MNYSYIIIPILVVMTSQVIKLTTDKIKGNFSIKNIFLSYGGMPSSHTALTISITTLVGLRLGIDSALFGVSLIFTILVMRDAITLRNILGEKTEKIKGHSALEIIGGIVWGVGLTYILALI